MTRQQQWDALARAARFPAHGRARRAREELRAFAHAQLRQDLGLGPRLLWWPIGKPLPEGATLARQKASHHSKYSQLIVVGGK